MRSSFPLLILAALAGCSGHGGGGSAALTSGSYRIANGADAGADACGFGSFTLLDGEHFPVTVTSTGFASTFGLYNHLVSAVVDGTAFTVPAPAVVVDWTDTAATQLPYYDCVETDTMEVGGTILGNALHTEVSVTYAPISGDPAACVAANDSSYGLTIASFPCTSAGSFDATRD
jgi:hypothetical protein